MNETINVNLEKMSVLLMIVRICSSEEVYDGRLAGFLYDGVCSCFCMYVCLYGNLYLYY